MRAWSTSRPALQDWSEAHAVNRLTLRGPGRPGVLVSGIGLELPGRGAGRARLADFNVLRIGAYPLPVDKIRALLDASSEVHVVEEGYPFIERYRRRAGPDARDAASWAS
jgi:indolepyruvate ferredoxin oxidoreductase alpha subunit